MRPLRVLIVEDSDNDAEMLRFALRRAGFDVTDRHVQTADAMREALLQEPWDVVVSDYSMPRFSAMGALAVLQQTGLDLPFIIVSSTIGEDTAVEAMRLGADDFMAKDRLVRLGPAIEREMREVASRRARRTAEQALTEAKEREQFALEAAGVGTWEVDLTTGATSWSTTMEGLHGVPPHGFPGSLEAYLALIDEAYREPARVAILGAPGARRHRRFEYRATWPDGSAHWIEGISRTIHRDTERPRAAGVAWDISEHKTLEGQFRQAQKMEAVGRLAGGIAHDFNNLLTAIIGYSDLLLDRLGEQEDLATDVREIKEAGERASQLTSQLLAFSRKQTSMPRVVDLNEVVASFQAILDRMVGDDVAVEVVQGASLGTINADPSQLEQILMNLVVNARDAMPRGGRVTITTANADLDEEFVRHHHGAIPGRHVTLTVADTGSGIPPEIVAQIFEPFFTTKPAGKGTGLGLATVYGIVKQNKGYISVDTAPGAGSRFTLYWPQVDQAVEGPEAPRAPRGDLRGTETVLLVEDEPGVRALVKKVVERYGYRVLSAPDADGALVMEAEYDGAIHLLLTDIVLPGLSGPDLAQRLVHRRPDMKVLYMSGFANHASGALAILSKKAAFLQKPFTPETLAAKIRDSLEGGSFGSTVAEG